MKPGHEALDARDVGLQGKDDDAVFQFAPDHQAALLTADMGFSNISLFPLGTHTGAWSLASRTTSPLSKSMPSLPRALELSRTRNPRAVSSSFPPVKCVSDERSNPLIPKARCLNRHRAVPSLINDMALKKVQIEIPEELLELVGVSPAKAGTKVREFIVMALLRQAKISQGKAASLLGLDR